MNRNWHALTAEYNTLYNGNLALELGKQELSQNYQDNFWQILPVEPMHLDEEVRVPGSEKNPNFAVAEEKAVKAIQRHSMLLEGRERNPQIDEAYLLLGKARYYDQRFVPALEAFNYVLHKYPVSNTINEARIWREKAHMRLDFNELAIKNLKQILDSERLEKENRANASAALAEAYMNISEVDSAKIFIREAARLTEDKAEKGRFWFITGQLYDALEKRDSANLAYQEVIDLNRKTPRIFRINAQIAQIRNIAPGPEGRSEVLAYLNSIAENRENRPFLDRVYFELAEFHYAMDSTELAVDFYNKSLRSSSAGPYLQSLNYETLGNINFDAANFEIAGAYYDSTLMRLPEESRNYRIIKRKRDNLNDVIHYEDMARSADSILKVAALSKEEQLAFYTEYTDKLREEALTTGGPPSETANEAANYFEQKRSGMPGMPTPGSNFYFYNPTTVAYGKEEFFRIWGDRVLTDNWRTGGSSGIRQDIDTTGIKDVLANDPRFDPQSYIAKIPHDPAVLDSLRADLNFANYQLGLIYQGKFGETRRAVEKLESVLQHEPKEELLIPAKYHLYKLYMELGENARADALKNDLIYQYPDSRYAAILQDPENFKEAENNPRSLYEQLYDLYEDQEYERLIEKSEDFRSRMTGDPIVPKIELLKAMAEGRLFGLQRYIASLRFVALNYPQATEGKKAQEILDNAIPSLPAANFQSDSSSQSFKLIFPFQKDQYGEAEDFQNKLVKMLEELKYSELSVSTDVYDPDTVLVVVHGFSSLLRAQGLEELFSVNEKYKINKKSFYISTPNYRIVQIHKNLDEYIKKFIIPPTNVRTGEKESTNN